MLFETDLPASDDRPIVFVIEREQVVRSALDYILRDRYQTYTFATLDPALASNASTPDVVLSGTTVLQGESGAPLAMLRERYGRAAILVVADRSSDPQAQRALASGARDIVSKPISFDSVCDAVDRALASRGAGQPHPPDFRLPVTIGDDR